MGCLAKEQAFSPVLHEVIVSDRVWVMGRSCSRWGPHVTVACCSGIQPCWSEKCCQMLTTPEKNLERKKKGGGGSAREREKDYRWHNMERKKELWHSQNLVLFALDMPSAKQALYIRFWGSHLVWCYELLLHKSVHYYAYEEGCSGRGICWLIQADVEQEPYLWKWL